jgi:hypothetical protein
MGTLEKVDRVEQFFANLTKLAGGAALLGLILGLNDLASSFWVKLLVSPFLILIILALIGTLIIKLKEK